MSKQKQRKNRNLADFGGVARNSTSDSKGDTNKDNTNDNESIESIIQKPWKADVTTFKGFYLDNDIINVIDRNTGIYRGDKSDLVNYILRKFFEENDYL